MPGLVCASTRGMKSQNEAGASNACCGFCAVPDVICCGSVTLTLSAARVNCTLGALKLLMVTLPVALVEPRDAARFDRVAELLLKRRLAFCTFTGCVNVGGFREALCIAPLPLNFRADAFLIGPVA